MLMCMSTAEACAKCGPRLWTGVNFRIKWLLDLLMCISTAQARTKCGPRLWAAALFV